MSSTTRSRCRREAGVSRFQVGKERPWRCDPEDRKNHSGMALGRAQRRLHGVRPGRLSVSLVRRRQRHRRRTADRARTSATCWPAILRIDVDHPEAGTAYGIPKDNPVRRIRPGAGPKSGPTGCGKRGSSASIAQTGDLWAGEVGQDLVGDRSTRSRRGATTAGASAKATHPFRPDRKKGPTPILKPIVEHPHADFRSITGGFVYRGSKLQGPGRAPTSTATTTPARSPLCVTTARTSPSSRNWSTRRFASSPSAKIMRASCISSIS